MRVTLRLFALARERVGQPEVELDLPEAAKVADLRRVLADAYPELAGIAPSLLIAVASEYADNDRDLSPGAELAAFPPVSGGGPGHGFSSSI
ncbi:MAG: MoaD/ThiS family protein [Isosphaeraceae bacterium]